MEINYDFFISYNHNDEEYAKWIAWILEEADYKVFIQAWDFQPGNNFILQMQKGSTNAQHTLALLSNNYMKSLFTQPEWAAAFALDPTGEARNLIPVLIEDIKLEGLLPQISYINLLEKDENEARQEILEGVQMGRKKPVVAPSFPGIIKRKDNNSFPTEGSWYAPWLDKRISELESGNVNIEINKGPKFALHLIPIEAISTRNHYEIKDLKKPGKLEPFYSGGYNYRINKDGFITFSQFPAEERPHSYVQIYRNAIIEAVDTGILKPRETKYIPIVKFEKDIIEHTKYQYLDVLKDLKVKLPIAVSISLFNMQEYHIPMKFAWSQEVIQQSTLKLPVVKINSWEENIEKLLRPAFDMLWNHCGFEKSLNYDDEGNWRQFNEYQ